MNKTMKRNVVISAILAIMLCVSLIAGATFALFTSESKTNVAVTSGKVDVKATIVNFKSSHPVSIDMATKEPSDTYLDGFWGGLDLASYNAETNSIELNQMVAGDKVTFDLVITNYSTVPVKFKTTYTATGDQDLIDVLDISVGNSTGWVRLDAASNSGSVVNTLNCYVEMPCSANVQGKSCALSFLVEAVQGNADVDVDNSVVYISNADEFIAFANEVNSGVNYEHKSVYLTNDIDLTGKTFNGIGGKHTTSYVFDGLFDGQNHTVKNFSVAHKCPDIDEGGNYQNGCYSSCAVVWDACAGLFTQLGGNGIVKNLIVSNATVNSTHYAGGIVGYAYGNSKIENCKVIDSNITSEVMTIGSLSDCGDKAGGIAGYIANSAVVNKCSVKNTTITAYRDLGAIVGYANDGTTVTNCTIEDGVVVKVDRSVNYKNYTQASEYDAGNFVGQADAVKDVTTGNTGSATILNADYYIYTANELFNVATNVNGNPNYYNNKTIQLVNDIDLENREWTPIGKTSNTEFRGTFDGNGKTIKNLKITEASDAAAQDAIGLFGWLGNNASGMAYVKNLTVENANVSGSHYVGAIVGYLQFGSVENCIVKNATVTATHKNDGRCGDKAGALIGYVAPNGNDTKVSNCKAIDCTVSAARDAAKLIGYGYAGSNFANLVAERVTVTAVIGECTHSRKGIVSADALIGNGTQDGLDSSNISYTGE